MTATRRIVQGLFLALVLNGVFVWGANCERWCPFGGVEGLYTYVQEGNMVCSLGTSNFFALGGLLLMTVLVRRAFCGYLCPIGAISEWMHGLGRRLRLPQRQTPRWLDRSLAWAKYGVLALILWLTWTAGELIFRGFDPCYALISRHGEDITAWAYVISAAILIVSLFITVPFCRWFCPLAAVMNPLSRFGLTRVRRDPATCKDCGVCSKKCPTAIPVDQVEQVTAARCISCLQCVESCPDRRSQTLVWGPPRWLGRPWSQAVLILIVVACTAAAVTASYLNPLPSFVKTRGVAPDEIGQVELMVNDVTCRGRANLLCYYIERDDPLFCVLGYLKIEAWPGPGWSKVRVTFDPAQTSEDAIRQAIVEPYYDVTNDRWRMSPFQIEGYDPLTLP
jgi:polyferredoxin